MFEGRSDLKCGLRQCLWVRNSEDASILLDLEPWGNQLSLQGHHDYLVVFEGPENHCPAVEWSDRGVTVHGWSGSKAWVLMSDQVILACETPVPN